MVAGRRRREKRVDGAAAVGGLEERGCKRLWTGEGHGVVTGGLSEGKRREQGKWGKTVAGDRELAAGEGLCVGGA